MKGGEEGKGRKAKKGVLMSRLRPRAVWAQSQLGRAGRQNMLGPRIIPPEEQRSQGTYLPILIHHGLRTAPEAAAPQDPGLEKESRVLAAKPCQHPRNGECMGCRARARSPTAHGRERRAIFQREGSLKFQTLKRHLSNGKVRL